MSEIKRILVMGFYKSIEESNLDLVFPLENFDVIRFDRSQLEQSGLIGSIDNGYETSHFLDLEESE